LAKPDELELSWLGDVDGLSEVSKLLEMLEPVEPLVELLELAEVLSDFELWSDCELWSDFELCWTSNCALAGAPLSDWRLRMLSLSGLPVGPE